MPTFLSCSLASQEAESPQPQADGSWAWEDDSEERDQRGLVTCLRPQSKQELGERTLEETQEERGCASFLAQGILTSLAGSHHHQDPSNQGEMQMFWPWSDCYSISPGVKGSVLTQYLSAPRLELAMDNFVGEVTFQATPVVPDTHGEKWRGVEKKPRVSWVSPVLHLPPLPGARQMPSTEPARSV